MAKIIKYKYTVDGKPRVVLAVDHADFLEANKDRDIVLVETITDGVADVEADVASPAKTNGVAGADVPVAPVEDLASGDGELSSQNNDENTQGIDFPIQLDEVVVKAPSKVPADIYQVNPDMNSAWTDVGRVIGGGGEELAAVSARVTHEIAKRANAVVYDGSDVNSFALDNPNQKIMVFGDIGGDNEYEDSLFNLRGLQREISNFKDTRMRGGKLSGRDVKLWEESENQLNKDYATHEDKWGTFAPNVQFKSLPGLADERFIDSGENVKSELIQENDEAAVKATILAQGASLLDADSKEVVKLQNKIDTEYTPGSEEYNKAEARIKELTNNADKLFDPTTGTFYLREKEPKKADEHDERVSALAVTDVETLENRLVDLNTQLVGGIKDLGKILRSTDFFKLQSSGLPIDVEQEESMKDARAAWERLGPLIESVEESNELPATMGELTKLFDYDYDTLQDTADFLSAPFNLNYEAKTNRGFEAFSPVLANKFNTALDEYLIVNEAIQTNTNPLSIEEKNYIEEAVDGIKNIFGADDTTLIETKEIFKQVLIGSGVDEEGLDAQYDTSRNIGQNIAKYTPALGEFAWKLSQVRKGSGNAIAKLGKGITNLIVKFGKGNKYLTIGAKYVIPALVEGGEFTSLGALENTFGSGPEEDLGESFKSGAAFGFGGAVGRPFFKGVGDLIKNSGSAPKFFDVALFRNLDRSKFLGTQARDASGAFVGASTYTLGSVIMDPLDYDYSHTLESLLEETGKMFILSKFKAGVPGFRRGYEQAASDILAMNNINPSAVKGSKVLGISTSGIKKPTEESNTEAITAAEGKAKEIKEKLDRGEITPEQANDAWINVSEALKIVQATIGANQTKEIIKQQQKDGAILTKGEQYVLGKEVGQGNDLTSEQSRQVTNISPESLLYHAGVEPTGTNIKAANDFIDQNIKINAVLNGESTYISSKGFESTGITSHKYKATSLKSREAAYKFLQEQGKASNLLESIKDTDRKDLTPLQLVELDKKLEYAQENFDKYIEGGTEENKIQEILSGAAALGYSKNVSKPDLIKGDGKGGKIIQIKDPNEFAAKLTEINGKSDVDGTKVTGFFDHTTGNRYINQKRALEVRDISVVTHEDAHFVVMDVLKDANRNVTPEGIVFIDKLLESISPKEREAIRLNINSRYDAREDNKEEWYEENLTVLSEFINEKKINFSAADKKNVVEVLKELADPLQKKYFKNLDTSSPKGMFDMLRGLAEGKEAAIDAANKFSKEAAAKSDGSSKGKAVLSKAPKNTVLEAINNLVPETVKTKADFQHRSVFNPIYQATLPNGSISNYIKSRSENAAVAEKTLESIQDRLINYDPAAVRKKANGEPITFGEFIFANTNFGKLDAKKALAIEAAETKRKTSIDSAEAKEIADTSKAAQVTQDKPKYRNLINSKVVSPGVISSIKDKVTKTLRTIKSKVDTKVSLNRTVTPLVAEIKNVMGKQADIDLKKAMGGKKDGVLHRFLLKNKKPILENMTTTWLMGAMPEAVQKQVNDRFTSDWQGKKIDREAVSTNNAGKTSGAEIVRRLPNVANKLSDKEFLSYVLDAKGNPIRGKKESLAKALAEEISFDIFTEQIKDPGSDLRKAFEKNQEGLGVVLAENIVEDLSRQVDRGSVKLSNTVMNNIHDLTKKIIREGGGSKEFDALLHTYDSKTIAVAKSLELSKNFGGGKEGFKDGIKDWNWGEMQPIIDTYLKTNTIGNTKVSMDQLAAYSTRLINILPPQIVRALPANFFSISNTHLDAARSKKDVGGNIIKGKQGEYVWIDDIRVAKAAEKDWDVKLPFDIKGVEIMNAGYGLFGGITTTLKNNMGKNDSVEDTLKAIDKKFGDRIEKANANNKLLLDYIMKEAATAIAKNKELAVGFLRWVESSDTKSLRGLTTLGLIEIIHGRQTIDKNNPMYDEATQRAIETSKRMYNKKEGQIKYKTKTYAPKKLRELVTEEEYIAHRMERPILSEPGLLRAKGEHMKAAAKVFIKLAKSTIGAADLIIKNPTAESQILTHLSLQNKKTLLGYSQVLTAKMNADILDFELGPTSDLGPYRAFAWSDAKLANLYTPKGGSVEDYLSDYFKASTEMKELGEAMDIKSFAENISKQKALNEGNSTKDAKTTKKIRVLDFDDTFGTTESNVLFTMPNGKKGKITPAEFAKKAGIMEAKGAEWDFSEFSKVMNGKKGPLFDVAKAIADKRGTKDLFVLTARPQDAAGPIKEFLKSMGIDIPIENITGLGNGSPKAKADWMIPKIAEGYNDFYFADDHIGNVKAVKDLLDTFDVKGRVQLAKVKFSKSLDKDFNDMIARNKGIASEAEFSKVVAKRRGAKIGKYKLWMPTTLDDFKGLTSYVFAGKGRQGDADQAFFQDALITPYFRGIGAVETARQTIVNDFKSLNKTYKPVLKKLGKLIPGGEYTYDQALRVSLWNKAGYDIPGLSKRDRSKLVELVANDAQLSTYADGALLLSKGNNWIKPTAHWDAETLLSDLNNMTEKGGRKEYIAEFIENADVIFSEKNLNKIEGVYGTRQRDAIEDILYRMKNGTNRPAGMNKINNKFNNWVNNSVGAIMFFNRRSSVLQLLSTVNFINWSDNNPAKAALAFANQPQYWADWATIFNSDKLKQRRSGLKGDVQEAEIASAVQGSNNKATAALSWLLKKGFMPTQIADSFAIASGGATFYRNRINTLRKQGMSEAAAEKQAWFDFSNISEETQQSGDPALISSDQASTVGRMVLTFMNTPIQLNRSIKKASLDIYNRRRTKGMTQAQSDFSNISKVIYYGAIQNAIFSSLQSAMFALIPGFNDDEETPEELAEKQETKTIRMISSMIDTTLKGGFGIPGAVLATVKNIALEYHKQNKKGFMADHTYTILQAANLAPPIGSKLNKVYKAIQTDKFEADAIKERGWDVAIDGKFNLSPKYSVLGNVVEGATNVPAARIVQELNSITEALDSRNNKWQQIALGLGWKSWEVGATNEEHDLIKVEAGERKKVLGEIARKKKREDDKEAEKIRVGNLSEEQLEEEDKIKSAKKKEKALEKERLRKKYDPNYAPPKTAKDMTPEEVLIKRKKVVKGLTKQEQITILRNSGLSRKKVRELQYEADRVDAIIEIRNKQKAEKEKLLKNKKVLK